MASLPANFSLETDRLLLTRLQASDLDAIAAIQADALTMQYVGNGQVRTRAQSQATLDWIAQHWLTLGYGLLAVQEKRQAQTIGWAGFIDPPEWPEFELGWVLSRDFWGQGYATEASSALLEVAKTELARKTVISMIRRPNGASVRVAHKLGMHFDVETTLFERPIDLYRIRF